MNKDAIQERLNRAIDDLVEHDVFLLDADVNERSITHQLALCLEEEFPDYDIDCEYNRMFKDGVRCRKSQRLLKKCLK